MSVSIEAAPEVSGVSKDLPDRRLKSPPEISQFPSTALLCTAITGGNATAAQGMPQEFVEVANEKMAKINTAYASIQKQRSLS